MLDDRKDKFKASVKRTANKKKLCDSDDEDSEDDSEIEEVKQPSYSRGDLRSMLISPKPQLPSSSSLLANKTKMWTCSKCTYASNASYNPSCIMCGSSKSSTSSEWVCIKCTFLNRSGENCVMCHSKRMMKEVAFSTPNTVTTPSLTLKSTPKPRTLSLSQNQQLTTKKKRKRELYFSVSSTTGRIFVYDNDKNFSRVNFSRDDILQEEEITRRRRAPLNKPNCLKEAREFLESWDNLKALQQKNLCGIVCRPPLVIPSKTLKGIHQKTKLLR